MNIAIYQPRASYYVGGGEVIPLEHACFLAQRGHHVTLMTTRSSFISESDYFEKFRAENANIKIVYFTVPESLRFIYSIPPGSDWRRWHMESLRIGQMAFKYFVSHKFDIVVVHNVLDTIAIPDGQKSALHLHGYPPHIDAIHEALLALPSRLIAVSKYIGHKWSISIPGHKCDVATNGVRPLHFAPNAIINKRVDVLYVGRLIPTKGVRYLIEAVAKLQKYKLDIHVVIAGEGPERKNLEALSKRLKVSQQIQFVGYVETRKLPALYQSARIAVFPSYDREGILTTMLEASACGVPVITTTACSMHEFLRDNRTGILVRPQNSSELARAMLMLCRDEKLRSRLGSAARKMIVTKWDWSIKILTVEKIYEKILHHN